jgi:thiol-disulfide isomerase/thioredoxin
VAAGVALARRLRRWGAAAVGSAAPAARGGCAVLLSLADAEDVRAFLAASRGEVAVVHLWATWCEPCLVELPRLQAAFESLTPWGVRFYTLAVDPPSNAEGVAAFVAAERLGFPVRVLREPAAASSARPASPEGCP